MSKLKLFNGMKKKTRLLCFLSILINSLSAVFMRKILQSDYFYVFLVINLLAAGYYFKVLYKQFKMNYPNPKSDI
jgi:hypothetical protein